MRQTTSLVWRLCALSLCLGLIAGTAPALAQPVSENVESASNQVEVRVGVRLSAPFVMENEDGFSGMAIELWEALAAPRGFVSTYVAYPNVRQLIDAAANGEIDAAVSNISITKTRAERVDFTQPWFDSGLRILVPSSTGASFGEVWAGLEEAGFLKAYSWLGGIIIVATILMTLFDRRFDKAFPRGWPEGLSESFYAVMSVVTSGKAPSRKNLFGWIGRIWQALWLVCGIAVMAYITSSVTSVMTTLSLNNQIQSVADLPGRTVGVFTGSVAEEFGQGEGWSIIRFDDLEEAVDALHDNTIDAYVGDAPVLEYYEFSNPGADVTVVGPLFHPDKYGFVLANGSPWTRRINLELLAAIEQGLVEEIRVRNIGRRD